jgi:hypothetical protein
MKVKGLLFVATFFMVTTVLFGQNKEGKVSKKEVLNRRESTIAKNKENSLPVLNTTDGYMGKKEEVLKRLAISEIPADFPRYKEGTPAGEYKKLMRAWGKLNQDLIKEEYRKK